jgi:signal transduction histidine kinase
MQSNNRTKRAALALAVAIAAPAMSQVLPAAPTPFETELAEATSIMMAEPQKALAHARAAARLALGQGTPRDQLLGQAKAHWLEGEALTRINQPDAADPVIAGALRQVERYAPRTKLHADLLMSAAAIDWMTGRVKDALAGFQSAHTIYAALGEARSQAKALQYIGTIYFDARDYPRMLRYYRQSEETYRGDPALTISALNNQGDALKEMKRFPEAIDLYRRALAIAHQLDSPVLEVRILTNLASSQYQAGNYIAADTLADRGLARAAGQDTGWEQFLWGVKAQAALARGDLTAARMFIGRTFGNTDLTKTTVQLREFHETAYKLFQRIGDDHAALAHLAAFKRLDDEAREVTSSTVSALLAARFDFANQELSITRLKAGQLQRDIALERSRTRLRTITLYGLIAALIIAGLIVIGTLVAALKLRRSRDEVKAANESLSVTNTALEKALRAKTEFLATTSHEIRTPLNGILGMTQVLMADRQLDRAVREKVEVVHGAGETMRALVDDILDVAKMETGELAIVEADVDFARLLKEAVRLWSGQAVAKNLHLALNMTADVPQQLRADEARLRQIVFNLLSNAIKFTPEGEVGLSIFTEREDDAEMLVMQVTDTGIGIAADRHEEIFEPFKQVEGGTDRRFGGTGLGLSICRNLTSAMQGTISVESALGQGACFTVRLPLKRLASASADGADARASGPPASLKDATVLMVEANPLARSILQAVIEPAVNAVRTVSDGPAALQVIEANGADLILVEAASASFEGHVPLESLGLLVAAAKAAAIPILVLFKPSEVFAMADMAALGADQIVMKPVAAPAVIQALDRLCANDASDRASAA